MALVNAYFLVINDSLGQPVDFSVENLYLMSAFGWSAESILLILEIG